MTIRLQLFAARLTGVDNFPRVIVQHCLTHPDSFQEQGSENASISANALFQTMSLHPYLNYLLIILIDQIDNQSILYKHSKSTDACEYLYCKL